jgi:hypothetical protein
MVWPQHDDLLKLLASRGVAESTIGKLIAGAFIDPSTTVGAALQNVDNVVNSVTLPLATLFDQVKRGILFAAYGTLAANANAKDIKVKLGVTTICVITDNIGNAVDYAFVGVILRTGVDAQSGFALALVNGALVAASSINFTATEDDGADKALTVTANNNAAAASAATGKGLVAQLLG